MPECAFHKGVETRVTCVECDRYICPKDMIPTPVGFKCRECGRMQKPRLGGVKPRQLLTGAAAGFGAAAVGGGLLTFIHFGIWSSLLYGALVGEATRRGSGGHRTWEFALIAAVAAFFGVVISAFFGRTDMLAGLIGPIVAAVYLLNARW